MTHLSIFSYPQRLSIIGGSFVWMTLITLTFRYNYFSYLLHKRDLRFWCYTLLGIHCFSWMLYDFITTVNVYYLNEESGMGLASNSTSLTVRYVCDGILDVTFTSHTSLLFLLISFWHTLFKAETASNFVTRWEFKIFIAYSIGSVVLYPVLQWSFFDEDHRLPVVIPQLMYFVELVFSSILFLVVVIRMRRFGKLGVGEQGTIIPLISLLTKLILLLTIANLLIGGSLTTINIVFVSHSTPEGAHDALTLAVWDFLTGVFSFSYFSMIILVTLILNAGDLSRMLSGHQTRIEVCDTTKSIPISSSSDPPRR